MKMKKYLLLGVVAFLMGSFALSQTLNNGDIASDSNSFVGSWNPDKLGWHGSIVISYEGKNHHLTMNTEEGPIEFDDVQVRGKEISWSYRDEVKFANWYLGKWSESGRTEILLDVNGIYGTSGTPTTVYQRGVNATHMLRTWQYHGVLIEDRLVISYGSKSDYYSSDDELLFDKVLELPSAFSYLKE